MLLLCEDDMSYYTRQQYLNDPQRLEKGRELHRKYYRQLVNKSTKAAVKRSIGMKRLLTSTDPNLNDIPLSLWDIPNLPLATKMENLGDYLTLAGKVCIAKEAAMQLIEEARGTC